MHRGHQAWQTAARQAAPAASFHTVATTLETAPASSPKNGQSSQPTASLAPSLPRATRARPSSTAVDAGLLTGGTGATETSDITYATPISLVLERLEAFGFNGRLKLAFKLRLQGQFQLAIRCLGIASNVVHDIRVCLVSFLAATVSSCFSSSFPSPFSCTPLFMYVLVVDRDVGLVG